MTLRALVDRERAHLLRAEVAGGSLLAVGCGLAVIALGAAVLGGARWLALPRVVPFVVWALVVACAAYTAWYTRRRLGARAGRRDVALTIEREHGLRRGLLVGALELEGEGALAARAAEQATRALPDGAALAAALRRDGTQRAWVGAGAALAGVLLLATTTPLFGDGLRAVLRPVAAWRGALLEPPRIEGAPAELLRGTPLNIRVRAPGRRVVTLDVREAGEPWRVDTLAVDARTGVATWHADALRADLRLVASDGRSASDSAVVRAADRPFVGAVTLRVTFPSYLARAAESAAAGEPLRLPRGSVVVVSGRASVPLAGVGLVNEHGATRALAVSGQRFTGRLVAEESQTLRWTASGLGSPVHDVPPPLELTVLPDSAPRVEIASPTADTLLATEEGAALTLTATDDHGIAHVSLRVLKGHDAGGEERLVARDVGTSWSGVASLDVATLGLNAGDVVRVRAEAVDASPWAQRGVSRELVLRRPTLSEQREVARALGDSAVHDAESAVAAQRSLAQRTGEAARAQTRDAASSATSQAKGAMSYEGAEKARALAREQRVMADRVQKLRSATQQFEAQLKAAGALDTSLAQQLGEAQALLRQALTPELAAEMQKLDDAASRLDGEHARDALRDLAQLQQKMREQLERSAEMLKRAAREGAMQTLGDEAASLAERQRAMGDGSAKEKGESASPRDAEKLAHEAGRLRDAMQKLGEQLAKDRAEAGASRTQQAGEHAGQSEAAMRKAGSGGEAAGAQDAARAMSQASRDMKDARREQVKEWKQELTAELDRSVQEMMQLAREERALEQRARSGQSGDDRRGAQSAVEQGVAKASERLEGAGRKSALLSQRSQRAVGDAKDKVAQATQKVAQQNGGGAPQQASALGEAADALTKAAASLARDRERANSASSASGFSEMLQQMQELAQRQGQVNAQAQGLMSLPGGANDAAGQQMSRALAKAQRGIADQLEDAGDASGGDRAAQLAREARQLADQLDGGRLDPGTLARQQQLFRRLLDAGKSLEKEERDDSGKRESKSAWGDNSFVPPGQVNGRAALRFRPPTWDELRGLSAEERRAVVDYFTRLNSAPPR